MTNENNPERKTQMKKIASIILAIIMTFAVLALAACNNTGNGDSTTTATPAGTTAPEAPKTDATTPAETEAPKPQIESALAFYTKVWNSLTDDQKFPAAGGDAKNPVDGGPGKFEMNAENAETIKWWTHVTDELYAMLGDDAATLQHMMNMNTFCSAMVKLNDPSKAAEFAEAYKAAIQAQRWMCGFPDTVIVISVGDYVIMAYGNETIIENFKNACLAADSQAKLLVEAPALPA